MSKPYTFAWTDGDGERHERTFQARSDGDAMDAVRGWLRIEGLSREHVDRLTTDSAHQEGAGV